MVKVFEGRAGNGDGLMPQRKAISGRHPEFLREVTKRKVEKLLHLDEVSNVTRRKKEAL